MKRNGNVLTGHCNCLAGLGGVCSHVGAILFAVEAGVRMLKSKTCTSVPCQWLMPSGIGNVSYAELQEIDFTSSNTKKRFATDLPTTLDGLYSEQLSSMSFTELLIKADEVFKEMSCSKEQAVNVEESTREQRNSKVWTKMRAGRITASNFHQICHTNPGKPSLSLIKQICYGSNFHSAATDWGIRQEKRALDEYRKVCSEKKFYNLHQEQK